MKQSGRSLPAGCLYRGFASQAASSMTRASTQASGCPWTTYLMLYAPTVAASPSVAIQVASPGSLRCDLYAMQQPCKPSVVGLSCTSTWLRHLSRPLESDARPNKELKLTKHEHIGASQLNSSVRRLFGGRRSRRNPGAATARSCRRDRPGCDAPPWLMNAALAMSRAAPKASPLLGQTASARCGSSL